MRATKIEWTERTWNPVTGCTKRSKGCEHCYAEVMARRLFAMGNHKYRNGFKNTIHPEALEEPFFLNDRLPAADKDTSVT